MFRSLLQSRRHFHQFIRIHARLRQNGHHTGLPFSQGARLVKNDGIHAAQSLQSSGGLAQDAQPRAPARPYHDGDGRGKPQNAGAGNHQHRNRPGKGEGKSLPGSQPRNQRHQGNRNHRRDKEITHPVRQPCNRSLGLAGLLHQADHAGQRGVPAHAFRTYLEIPGPVERAADHPVSRRLVHRHAFPRQVRFIQRGLPFFNDAVHRNPLPGFHHHQVPGMKFIQRDGALRAVMPNQGLLGNQLHQPFHGGVRLAVGTAFKIFPQGNQGDDHGRGFKIQFHSVHVGALPQRRNQQIQPVQEGGTGADGDQGIHIGRQRGKLAHAVD